MNGISTSSTGVTIAPIGLQPARIVGYDVARAIAFLGMVFVNYKFQMGADQYGVEWLLWLSDWLEGRPAVTFVILAGVGMTLLKMHYLKTEHVHPFAKSSSTILRRAIFLFFLGLFFSSVWCADILHFYGVYFVAAIFLVNASDGMIWILAGVSLIISLVLPTYFDIAAISTIDSVWDPQFWKRNGFIEDLFFNGSYPVFPWFVYFLLGIWLGRKNLSDDRLQKKIVLIAGLCIIYCELIAWLVQNILIPASDFDHLRMLRFFTDTSPFSLSLISIFSASGTALLVIIVSIKLADKASHARWLKPLVATAQMSLTLYIVHIGVFQLFLMVSGLEDIDNSLEFAWLWAAVFCLGAIPFSYYWAGHFGRGPFEKMLRWVSK
jgi:uncharacterized membrane protein YeiB